MEGVFIIVVCLALFHQGQTSSIYGSLLQFVRQNHNPNVPPRTEVTQPLMADFQAGLLNIENVDRKTGKVSGLFWLFLSWNTTVTWDPSDFHGKTSVMTARQMVYVPPMSVVNWAGPTQQWHHEVVFLYPGGTACLEKITRGSVYCGDTFDERDMKCRLRIGTGGNFRDVLAFVPESEHAFNMTRTFEPYYFSGSRYEVTSQGYEVHRKEFHPGMEYEYMDYVFSFREKPGSHRDSTRSATIRFH